MPKAPVVLAYGMGVDSTAMLLELFTRGEAPDLVLTADTGSEKPATYAYLDGYDASPTDTRRHAHALTIPNDRFECRYPLREWGWSRDDCIARIEAEGLPVPPKSACYLCCGSKPEEIRALPAWCLRIIVLVEARAAPRLRTVEGLWRKSTRTRPGRMTDFIRAERLLEPGEIDRIVAEAPTALKLFQDAAADIPLPDRPHLADWIAQFQRQLETVR